MTVPDSKSKQERPSSQNKMGFNRGNVAFALGLALVAALIIVIGLEAAAVTRLGYVSASTAIAMMAVAITVLAVISFLTLTTLRRTAKPADEAASVEPAPAQGSLATRVQEALSSNDLARDTRRSADMAVAAGPHEAPFLDRQSEYERRRVRLATRVSPVVFHPFDGGRIHPLREIEGIGRRDAAMLTSLGIKDTKRLWNADASFLAGALNVTPELVDTWQCIAELMAVEGIDNQHATLLVSAGVLSIRALCAETPPRLLDRIIRLERIQGPPVPGPTIGIKTVAGWIHAAQAHGPAPPHDAKKPTRRQGA